MGTTNFSRAFTGALVALALLATPAGAEETREGPAREAPIVATAGAEVSSAATIGAGWVQSMHSPAVDVAVVGLDDFGSGASTAIVVENDGTIYAHSYYEPGRNNFNTLLGGGAASMATTVRRVVDGEEQQLVMVRAFDGAMYATRTAIGNFGSSGWEGLGGLSRNAPIAATDAQQRVHLFVVGLDDALWHNVLVGSAWGGWHSLGGFIAGDPAADVSPLGIEVTAPGRDGALWTGRITGTGTWSGWTSLGGVIASYPWMAANADGTWAFVVGSDDAMWVNRMTPSGVWTGWRSLGGFVISGPGSAVGHDGRLYVFGVGGDLAGYVQQVTPSGGLGWQSLGGTIISNMFGSRQGTSIRVWAVGGDGRLYSQLF